MRSFVFMSVKITSYCIPIILQNFCTSLSLQSLALNFCVIEGCDIPHCSASHFFVFPARDSMISIFSLVLIIYITPAPSCLFLCIEELSQNLRGNPQMSGRACYKDMPIRSFDPTQDTPVDEFHVVMLRRTYFLTRITYTITQSYHFRR